MYPPRLQWMLIRMVLIGLALSFLSGCVVYPGGYGGAMYPQYLGGYGGGYTVYRQQYCFNCSGYYHPHSRHYYRWRGW